jgi:hypothetical protein
MRHRTITTTATGLDRTRNRVQYFKFVHYRTELGKADNTFAFEITVPLHCPYDLADDLGQPPQGMGFVKRDRIGRRRQEVTTLTNQGLQMQFNGLSVEQDDRASIPRSLGVRFQVQAGDESLGGSVERPGVQINFDVAAVVPGSVVRLGYRLRLGKLDCGWFLLHRRSFQIVIGVALNSTAKPLRNAVQTFPNNMRLVENGIERHDDPNSEMIEMGDDALVFVCALNLACDQYFPTPHVRRNRFDNGKQSRIHNKAQKFVLGHESLDAFVGLDRLDLCELDLGAIDHHFGVCQPRRRFVDMLDFQL